MMEAVSEKQNTPLVSVIMPAYNCGRFIEAAVGSVVAQTVTDWELLILDDCSTEPPSEAVIRLAQEDSRIRLLRNPHNMGAARTRNRGIDLAEGKYIAFLDSDDLWHPEKLAKQLRIMEQTGADLCYTSYEIIDETGAKSKADYLVPEQIDFAGLLNENVLGCSTVMLPRRLLENHRFTTDFYHEDYVLWLTLLREGYRACGCREVLTQWRLVANSRSFNKLKSARNRWRIYSDYLQLPFGQKVLAFLSYAGVGLRKYGKRGRQE